MTNKSLLEQLNNRVHAILHSKIVIAITALALIVSFAFSGAAKAEEIPWISVDGSVYLSYQQSGPVDHYLTPSLGVTSQSNVFTARHRWNGVNGAEVLANCQSLNDRLHWVDNNNVLTISHCVHTPVITPSPIPTRTPFPTATFTPSNTPFPTPTNTVPPTNTVTFTPAPSNTPFPTPTNTVPPTNTVTFTPVPSNTPFPTPTNTVPPTNTVTFTPAPSNTPTEPPTLTPTATPAPRFIAFGVDVWCSKEQKVMADGYAVNFGGLDVEVSVTFLDRGVQFVLAPRQLRQFQFWTELSTIPAGEVKAQIVWADGITEDKSYYFAGFTCEIPVTPPPPTETPPPPPVPSPTPSPTPTEPPSQPCTSATLIITGLKPGEVVGSYVADEGGRIEIYEDEGFWIQLPQGDWVAMWADGTEHEVTSLFYEAPSCSWATLYRTPPPPPPARQIEDKPCPTCPPAKCLLKNDSFVLAGGQWIGLVDGSPYFYSSKANALLDGLEFAGYECSLCLLNWKFTNGLFFGPGSTVWDSAQYLAKWEGRNLTNQDLRRASFARDIWYAEGKPNEGVWVSLDDVMNVK